jgi:hypothetical protein
LEVEAILACDLGKGPDVKSRNGRSWREEGGREVHSLPTCHVAMLQDPKKVADLIIEAAEDAAKRIRIN